MKSKTLGIWALVAVAAAALAVILDYARSGPDAVAEGEYLVKELRERAGEVQRIELSKGDQRLVAAKQDAGWVAPELDGYPVKFDKVRELLLHVASLKTEEALTANPELWSRLELEDPAAPEAKSALLALYAGEEPLVRLVMGRTKYGAQPAVYVRRDGENQAWACSYPGSFMLDANPMSWVEREVVRLEHDRVQWAEIVHPDGETLRVSRPDLDTDYQVEGLPEGRELSSPRVGDAIPSSLAWVSFDEVAAAANKTPGDAAVTRTRFHCFNGLEILVESWLEGEEAWCRFSAEVPEATGAAAAAGQEGGDEGAGGAGESQEAGAAPPEPEEAAAAPEKSATEEAAELNGKWSPWVYRFGSYKSDQFRRRMADLLKPLPAPPPPEEEGGGAGQEDQEEGG